MNDITFETTSYSCKYDPGEGKAEYHVEVTVKNPSASPASEPTV